MRHHTLLALPSLSFQARALETWLRMHSSPSRLVEVLALRFGPRAQWGQA